MYPGISPLLAALKMNPGAPMASAPGVPAITTEGGPPVPRVSAIQSAAQAAYPEYTPEQAMSMYSRDRAGQAPPVQTVSQSGAPLGGGIAQPFSTLADALQGRR